MPGQMARMNHKHQGTKRGAKVQTNLQSSIKYVSKILHVDNLKFKIHILYLRISSPLSTLDPILAATSIRYLLTQPTS